LIRHPVGRGYFCAMGVEGPIRVGAVVRLDFLYGRSNAHVC
jgi:hypothetical protein